LGVEAKVKAEAEVEERWEKREVRFFLAYLQRLCVGLKQKRDGRRERSEGSGEPFNV
jgi:hypothetical protein